MTDKHTGSTFDSFLKEEGILESVTEVARERISKMTAKHTDETWFLHLQGDNIASIQTTNGVPLVRLENCPPTPRAGFQSVPQQTVDTIRSQFKANVRVMAAGRTMLDYLKLIADDPTNADLMAREAIAFAEPPLHNVTHNNNVGAVDNPSSVKFTGTHDECFEYILKHQGQSADYALKHGGWKIDPA